MQADNCNQGKDEDFTNSDHDETIAEMNEIPD
jgi:hypothetical protein